MPEICRKCASERKSCCYHSRIAVTIPELERLLAKGYTADSLLVARKYQNEGSWDKNWDENMAIRVGRQKYELCIRHKNEGGCMFLGNEGCTIKPDSFLCCKVFPFWSTENKMEYDKDKDNECPLTKLPVKKTLKLLGETEKNIQRYMSEMKKDAEANKEKRKLIIKELVDKGLVV